MSADAVSRPSLIDYYYNCFNTRRLMDAAALFSEGQIEFVPGTTWQGQDGYLQFANTWISAFPDVTFAVESVNCRNETVCETYFRAIGTHTGVFNFGRHRFQPAGTKADLHLRELLDIHEGRIRASIVSPDFNDLVRQLAHVDYQDVVARLDRICELREELKAASAERRREAATRLGSELDAARKALRPHFRW
jgi:predicted ester cyclase